MENSFKPSTTLKILLGVAACLMLLALYFFIMAMLQSSGIGSTTNRSDDTNVLKAEITALEVKIDSIETQAAINENTLSQKQALIEQLQQQTAGAACETPQQDESFIQAQKVCQQKLSNNAADLSAALQSIKSLRDELSAQQEENQRLAQSNTQENNENEIQARQALALMTEENTLLRASLADTQAQLLVSQQAVLDTNTVDLLQIQLTNAEDENSRLLNLVNELRQLAVQTESQQNSESGVSSSVLTHTKFEAKPSLCDTQFSNNRVCVVSVDIEINFNFNPNGFVSLRLIGPDGNTVDRQSVAARTVNKVTFDFDAELGSQQGEYVLELKIDDVFNKYDARERFSI